MLESNDYFRVFKERTTTVSGLSVNMNTVGQTLSTATDTTVSGKVTSYFVHFDPVGAPTGVATLAGGSLTFDGNIVGIIWKSGVLNATDSVLGLSGTTYTPATARGYEFGVSINDTLNFTSANSVDFVANVSGAKIDSFRVLLAASPVPEPPELLVMLVGLAALCFCRSRKTA